MRELLLWSGTCAASNRSLKFILGNKGHCKQKGQVSILIVGGAAESLEARPGRFKLVLKNRKGFIRVALETGTSLVPVFSFGENEVFFALENPENSRLRRFQNVIKKHFHFGLPVISGRGVFNYSFGLLPHRKPMHTVIGAPIKVTKNAAPTTADIEALHALYISKLNELFEEHKHKYLTDKTIELQFV
jgi:2-acylglycerol O-acyltransferase 2